jgi:hypothetical protein
MFSTWWEVECDKLTKLNLPAKTLVERRIPASNASFDGW